MAASPDASRRSLADVQVHIVTLGCAKNAVDSSSMAQLLEARGCRMVAESNQADVIVVNTCGFIAPARQESIDTLRRLARSRQPGQLLVAAGCLTQRSGPELVRELEGIDGAVGTRRWMDIGSVVERVLAGGRRVPVLHFPHAPVIGPDPVGVTRAHATAGSAYLKIADGCSRACAFCAIPQIKGPAVSRAPDSILADARSLSAQGVLEINLIAQDTTTYGIDLGMTDGLAHLMERMASELEDVRWIRLLYAYPGCVTPGLVDVMAAHARILPYLDMPLQHAHPETLRRMGRPRDVDAIRRSLATLRERIPGMTLRTTFLVGFPGETEAEFQALLDFVSDVGFDRIGAFVYSREAGTPAEPLGDPVPMHVKRERYARLMARQQALSRAANERCLGQDLEVLIEGSADGISIGRSYRDAPEIDGLVIVDTELPVGRMAGVRVTGAQEYDLTAEVRRS